MSHARVQHDYDNTVKNLTTDSKTNYDAETNTSDVKKIKNRRKQNLEMKQTTRNWIKWILNESN